MKRILSTSLFFSQRQSRTKALRPSTAVPRPVPARRRGCWGWKWWERSAPAPARAGQVRAHQVETARALLEALIREATGVKVVSLHHDISTVTGEEVILFALAEAPALRDTRKR